MIKTSPSPSKRGEFGLYVIASGAKQSSVCSFFSGLLRAIALAMTLSLYLSAECIYHLSLYHFIILPFLAPLTPPEGGKQAWLITVYRLFRVYSPPSEGLGEAYSFIILTTTFSIFK